MGERQAIEERNRVEERRGDREREHGPAGQTGAEQLAGDGNRPDRTDREKHAEKPRPQEGRRPTGTHQTTRQRDSEQVADHGGDEQATKHRRGRVRQCGDAPVKPPPDKRFQHRVTLRCAPPVP
jgi:hypothetical protein